MKKIQNMKYMLMCLSAALLLAGCTDFLYEDSDEVLYADKEHLTTDADTLWSVAGIMNKLQVIADRTILLGELRGDLVDVTSNASADLRQLALFNIGEDNKYNSPRDYYAIINNCNYFLAKADTALRNNRNELIFMKEFAAVKAYRAWTYLQLALNYQSVPFITEPIMSKDDTERDYPMYGIQDICEYFINDIAPYADIETPGYKNIRNTNSKLFYFPIYILLGDMNLWTGNYREAARNYYKYLSSRNGTNSAYPLTTNSVRFSANDSHWMTVSDSWSMSSFSDELGDANSELITMIPGDSVPSEGEYSELRNIFNTNENNEYKVSVIPSQSIIDLSAAQKYCHYTTGGEYVIAPDGLDDYRTGDLRLQSVYRTSDNANIMLNGKRITNYTTLSKYSTRNVHIYRRAMVYLRLAEALNRAGFPRFAFLILKSGVNNNVINNEVLPYYPDDAEWLSTFDFPNTSYSLETTAGLGTENTMGIHSRGCGYSASNNTYVFPDDTLLTDTKARLDYQIKHVEDLIIDEEALEFAFEGHRFYDLMRIALRRNDPSYLANRVYQRRGATEEATMRSLITTDLNNPQNWYLKLEE